MHKISKAQVNSIFEVLSQSNPNPRIELNYTNYYTLLVAVVLSAQATDKGVNKATDSLFKAVYSPLDMVELGEDGLIEFIKSIGLYKTKARNVIKLSTILLDKLITLFGKKTHYTESEVNLVIPNNLDDLISLPGVGRKTANVILNQVFHLPTIAVDTHVFRVSHRLGLSNGKTPLLVEQDLLKVISKAYIPAAHHLLILFGRYTCKATNFNCSDCILQSLCSYQHKRFK